MCDPLNLFQVVLSDFHNHTKWDSAEFGKIKTISNTKVGSVGQNFIERLCKELEIECIFPVNEKNIRLNQSPWDIQIGGIKLELKTATEDVNGKFQFNHIRYHRKYQGLMCLGVSPNNLFFGIWSKADVTTGKAGALVSMEKSANASYKLTKAPIQLHPISEFKVVMARFCQDFV